MMSLTRKELDVAQQWMTKGLALPAEIQGVRFGDPGILRSIAFRYGNATGLIFTDNGYLGPQPDGKDYYLLWRLSCRYSNDCKFNPTFEPNLDAAAAAVIASWELFTGRGSAVQSDSG